MAQLPSQSQFGDYGEWPGRDVLDSGGERLGGVREIYLDRETGRPEWVLVDVADDEARFVPLADASVESSQIKVAHSAAAIRSAPGIGSEPRIDQSEERRLYDHYGLGYSESDSGSGLPDETRQPGAAGPTPTAWGSDEKAADPWGADEPKPDPWTPEEETKADDDPWQTYQGKAVSPTPPWREGTEEEPSSWSAAAEQPEPTNLAPPPADPPSPAEIEEAEIPEPPAASEHAFEDFTATTEPVVAEAEPTAAERDAALAAAAGAEPLAGAPEPAGPEADLVASGPDAATGDDAATPEPDLAAAAAVAPTTAGEILAATPEAEDLKAQPGPDAVRPTEPPRIHQVPPPAPEAEAGPLGAVAARKNQVAIGAAVALVLLFLIRKLR